MKWRKFISDSRKFIFFLNLIGLALYKTLVILKFKIMKLLKGLITLLIFSNSIFGFGQWTVYNTAPDHHIDAFSFVDDHIGYAFMYESFGFSYGLKKTADGGNSWTDITLPLFGPEFLDMHFYAEGEGVVVMRDFSNMATPTLIFQTLDDGATWQDISPDSTEAGIGFGLGQFIDQNIGFLAVDQVLYSTTDGGSNWNSTTFSAYPVSMDFIDAMNGTIGFFDGTFSAVGSAYCTSDGGATWQGFTLPDDQTVIGKVVQTTSSSAYAAPIKWAAGEHLEFYKTNDNGNTWDTLFVPDHHAYSYLADLDFRNELNGVITIISQDTTFVYHTSNGGNIWVFNDSMIGVFNYALELAPNNGYLSGGPGIFHKFTGTASLDDFEQSKLTIYPNPVVPGQTITWESNEAFSTLFILDISGKLVYQESIKSQNNVLIPELSKGIYIVQLQNNDEVKTSKIVVNNF